MRVTWNRGDGSIFVCSIILRWYIICEKDTLDTFRERTTIIRLEKPIWGNLIWIRIRDAIYIVIIIFSIMVSGGSGCRYPGWMLSLKLVAGGIIASFDSSNDEVDQLKADIACTALERHPLRINLGARPFPDFN